MRIITLLLLSFTLLLFIFSSCEKQELLTSPPNKDTVWIFDTLKINDTVKVNQTVIKTDTIIKTMIDTIIGTDTLYIKETIIKKDTLTITRTFFPSLMPEVSLEDDVQPIFTSKCIVCHYIANGDVELVKGKTRSSLISFNLINTTNPTESPLYKAVAGPGATMPDVGTKLSLEETDKILIWIAQGAKDN